VKVDVVYNKSCQRMTELPDEPVDMSMTSPPYWGLRDYGDDVKEIWGGDKDCEHRWGNGIPPKGNKSGPHGPGSTIGAKLGQDGARRGKGSNFCQNCHAWHGQLGLEPTFQLYLDHMLIVCAEIKRVLKKTGSFWLNMGDTYACKPAGNKVNYRWQHGHKPEKNLDKARVRYDKTNLGIQAKCLMGIPWRLVLRLIDEQGWILRNAIIWHKPNAMPSSVKDRCSNSYEFLFHLVKAKKYYYDLDAIRETQKKSKLCSSKYGRLSENNKFSSQEGNRSVAKGTKWSPKQREYNPAGKNPGDVWTIPTQPRPEAHFATFPDKLCIKPILATCPQEICKKCGKARVRITNTKYIPQSKKSDKEKYKSMAVLGAAERDFQAPQGMKYGRANAIRNTIGWTDCGCNAGWDSGVLLDPFAGRGTSLIMAKKLGRHYIGYELKREYADMAERELENIDPLFRRKSWKYY